MKILLLQDDFPPESLGGAGIVAFRLAKELQKENEMSVNVIAATSKKEEEGWSYYEGIKIFRIYSSYHERWRGYLSLYNPYTVKKLKQMITELKPDIVHAHNIHYHLSYHSLKISKNQGAKVFLTAHDVMLFHYGKLTELVKGGGIAGCDQSYKVSFWQQIRNYKRRYNPFRNIIIKYYLRYVDKVFAVSAELKKALTQNGMRNIEVVHNGINVEDWVFDSKRSEDFKSKYNLLGRKVVLFGGRLSEAKGGSSVASAMKEVFAKIPNAVLLVIGEKNDYAEKIEKMLGHYSSINLVFTGWISGNDLKSAYQSADLVVAPSTCFDSLPTVVLEALANKKPAIASCFGGAKEALENNISGFIVNPFDIGSLSEKIIDLLTDSRKAERFGEIGFETINKKFNSRLWKQKYLKSYF